MTYATRPDQALLYRLSGDRNPLHSDPTFAKRAGFDRPILHGLCTYGFTGRALLHTVCGSDPARFGAMRARFSKPTMPGDTLTISVWDIGERATGAYRFRTETQRGETVIDAGLFSWPLRSGRASAAPGADAEHIEAVALRFETLRGGQLVDGQRDLALEIGTRRDVAHLAAAHAQQMVVVLGQVLGQLEAGELVAGRDAADEAGGLQVGQVAVGGAPGQIGESVGDVADADRVTGVTEQLDDGPAPDRVRCSISRRRRLGHLVEGVLPVG